MTLQKIAIFIIATTPILTLTHCKKKEEKQIAEAQKQAAEAMKKAQELQKQALNQNKGVGNNPKDGKILIPNGLNLPKEVQAAIPPGVTVPTLPPNTTGITPPIVPGKLPENPQIPNAQALADAQKLAEEALKQAKQAGVDPEAQKKLLEQLQKQGNVLANPGTPSTVAPTNTPEVKTTKETTASTESVSPSSPAKTEAQEEPDKNTALAETEKPANKDGKVETKAESDGKVESVIPSKTVGSEKPDLATTEKVVTDQQPKAEETPKPEVAKSETPKTAEGPAAKKTEEQEPVLLAKNEIKPEHTETPVDEKIKPEQHTEKTEKMDPPEISIAPEQAFSTVLSRYKAMENFLTQINLLEENIQKQAQALELKAKKANKGAHRFDYLETISQVRKELDQQKAKIEMWKQQQAMRLLQGQELEPFQTQVSGENAVIPATPKEAVMVTPAKPKTEVPPKKVNSFSEKPKATKVTPPAITTSPISPVTEPMRDYRVGQRKHHVTISPIPPETKPAPPTPPVGTVSHLEQAQQALAKGDYVTAMQQANFSNLENPGKRWRIAGAAACALHQEGMVNRAFNALDAAGRQYLIYTCQRYDFVSTGSGLKWSPK